jgi:hypothetical protein
MREDALFFPNRWFFLNRKLYSLWSNKRLSRKGGSCWGRNIRYPEGMVDNNSASHSLARISRKETFVSVQSNTERSFIYKKTHWRSQSSGISTLVGTIHYWKLCANSHRCQWMDGHVASLCCERTCELKSLKSPFPLSLLLTLRLVAGLLVR